MSECFLASFAHRHCPELREFAEVLDGCCEVEFLRGAAGSSEAEALAPRLRPADFPSTCKDRGREERWFPITRKSALDQMEPSDLYVDAGQRRCEADDVEVA